MVMCSVPMCGMVVCGMIVRHARPLGDYALPS